MLPAQGVETAPDRRHTQDNEKTHFDNPTNHIHFFLLGDDAIATQVNNGYA
jgi:hypothetical protein